MLLPITLTGSTATDLERKTTPALGRLGFEADADNSLLLGNGTALPWRYPNTNKVQRMITDALALVTSPIIIHGNVAITSLDVLAGSSVNLKATGAHSALECDPRVSVGYIWLVNGIEEHTGNSVDVTAKTDVGERQTVVCRAIDTLGNVSVDTVVTITSFAPVNKPPDAPVITKDLPETIVRGGRYQVMFRVSDPDNDDIAISVTGNGCTVTSTAPNAANMVVADDAQSVIVVITATDSHGATASTTISRDASQIIDVPPTSTFGAGTHTYTVPAGFSELLITGWSGSVVSINTEAGIQWDDLCYFLAVRADTLIKNGNTVLHTFSDSTTEGCAGTGNALNGKLSGDKSTVTIDVADISVLTIVVPQYGGIVIGGKNA